MLGLLTEQKKPQQMGLTQQFVSVRSIAMPTQPIQKKFDHKQIMRLDKVHTEFNSTNRTPIQSTPVNGANGSSKITLTKKSGTMKNSAERTSLHRKTTTPNVSQKVFATHGGKGLQTRLHKGLHKIKKEAIIQGGSHLNSDREYQMPENSGKPPKMARDNS